jgi:DNA (cytosine-5)-methyltransferase 1
VSDERQLTVIDLFAGCGGLALGLELVGFCPVLAAELNDSARNTYGRNRPYLHTKNLFTDVRALRKKSTGELRRLLDLKDGEYPSLLSGGPPCQGFSGIGHRRTNSDIDKYEIASNHLYADMVSLIGKTEPSVFLFENVRGLLSARWYRDKPEKVWDTIRSHFLKHLGKKYVIAFDIVHGFDYGVPQNRPRLLMIGVHERHWSRLGWTSGWRDGVRSETAHGTPVAIKRGLLPQPIPWRSFVPHIEELLGDLVDPEWASRSSGNGRRLCVAYPSDAVDEWQVAMRAKFGTDSEVLTAGAPVNDHEFSRHSARVVKRFEAAQASADGQAPRRLRTRKFAQRALPSRWNGKLPSITVASLPDDFVHFRDPRSLTVREWARLQGFPDWYQFAGPRTTGGHRRVGDVRSGDTVRETPKYTQIGNAVPVPLAAAVGWHIRRLLGVRDGFFRGELWESRLSRLLRRHFEVTHQLEDQIPIEFA